MAKLFLSLPYSSTVFDPGVSTDGNADESRLAVCQGCCRASVRWKENCENGGSSGDDDDGDFLQFAKVVVVPVFAGKAIVSGMKTVLQLILFVMLMLVRLVLVLVTKLLAMMMMMLVILVLATMTIMMLVRLALTCEHFKRFCWASACPVADRTEICQMNHDDYIINGVKKYCNTVINS